MAAILADENVLAPVADQRYRVGVWTVIASVIMFFTSLTSAYIVRAASAPDWHTIAMPRILWLSTGLILISSATFETARKNIKRLLDAGYVQWLSLTIFLGAGFLAAQLLAWRQLAARGVFVSTNPHSSFFYLLSAMHGLHLLVGLLGLLYLLVRTRTPRVSVLAEAKRIGLVDATAIYWHFMAGLWVFLFLLLFVWRSV